VLAGDVDGKKCSLVAPNDQGIIIAPGLHDTSDVNVNVIFKYCSYYISPNSANDDTAARGDIHFHADDSWKGGYAANGEPTLTPAGAIAFDCHLNDVGGDCVRGDEIDKALAYGTQVMVTYTPHDHNRVIGVNPFTGEGFEGAINATVTLTGIANKTLDFDHVVFSTETGTSTPVSVAVTTGGNTPASQTVATGSTNVPVLQFVMTPATPVTLDGITLTASGNGDDHIDITAVKLFVDANGNGVVDGSESALASGTYGANNGTVTLPVLPPYTVSAPTSFLVTYDFNETLASRFGGAMVLAGLLPVFLVPRKRRRGIAGAIVLVAGLGVASLELGACGGDSTGPNPPPSGSATFTATLNGMTASGTAVSGVSVQGATISIAK
jgi:hypothetical protein